MTLAEIRKTFVVSSGRYDLVKDTTEYEDNGANSFINAGQKFLDLQLATPSEVSVWKAELKSGKFEVLVPDVRSIEEVYVVDSDERSFYLERLYLQDFKTNFNKSSDLGRPKYWALGQTLNVDGNESQLRKQAVIVAPYPDSKYTVFVRGKFFSPRLENEKSISFWSINYPHILVQAAMYELEKFYRNTQGMNDHYTAIMQTLQGIDFDEAQQQSENFSNMRDSFNEDGRI